MRRTLLVLTIALVSVLPVPASAEELASGAASAPAPGAPLAFPGVPGVDLASLGYTGPALESLDAVAALPDLPGDAVGAAVAASTWLVEARDVQEGLVEATDLLTGEVQRLGPVVARSRQVAGRAEDVLDTLEEEAERLEEQVEARTSALDDRQDLLAEAAIAAYVKPPGMDALGSVLRGDAGPSDALAAAELFESRIDNDLLVEGQLQVEVAMTREAVTALGHDVDRARDEDDRAAAVLAEAAEVRDAHRIALERTSSRLEDLSLGVLAMEAKLEEVFAEAIATVGGGEAGRPRGEVPTVRVEGVEVHVAIAARFQAMVVAAREDGVHLLGWGFRSYESQVSLRKAHCGETDVEIWLTPPSACSPPTAIPGTSQHEVGLAIDFAGVSSRSHPAFVWLAEHAATYGFQNLPSEPWHWSVDGR